MTDYISREDVVNAINSTPFTMSMFLNKDQCVGARQARDSLALIVKKSIPAADVRSNITAEWLTGNDNPRTYGRIRAMCGRCGAFALYEMVNAGSFKEHQSHFCPNCGAKMTEEQNDAT